jgi:hypothetical protein
LERLRRWPAVSGAKPLTGDLAGKYRLRTGDYRIRFRVETTRILASDPAMDKKTKRSNGKRPVTRRYKIVIEKIGHRDEFYDD